ncbi:MAG: hypothetical protein M1814_001073 [Vezdaea aestivalis]|nr:MAG: hypothetical protein M1814_001073 [Vezdaea aestivalis]
MPPKAANIREYRRPPEFPPIPHPKQYYPPIPIPHGLAATHHPPDNGYPLRGGPQTHPPAEAPTRAALQVAYSAWALPYSELARTVTAEGEKDRHPLFTVPTAVDGKGNPVVEHEAQAEERESVAARQCMVALILASISSGEEQARDRDAVLARRLASNPNPNRPLRSLEEEEERVEVLYSEEGPRGEAVTVEEEDARTEKYGKKGRMAQMPDGPALVRPGWKLEDFLDVTDEATCQVVGYDPAAQAQPDVDIEILVGRDRETGGGYVPNFASFSGTVMQTDKAQLKWTRASVYELSRSPLGAVQSRKWLKKADFIALLTTSFGLDEGHIVLASGVVQRLFGQLKRDELADAFVTTWMQNQGDPSGGGRKVANCWQQMGAILNRGTDDGWDTTLELDLSDPHAPAGVRTNLPALHLEQGILPRADLQSRWDTTTRGTPPQGRPRGPPNVRAWERWTRLERDHIRGRVRDDSRSWKYAIEWTPEWTYTPIDLYTIAVRFSPYNPAYWTARAFLYYQHGQYDLAMYDCYRAQILVETVVSPIFRCTRPGIHSYVWQAVEYHVLRAAKEDEHARILEKLQGPTNPGPSFFLRDVRVAYHHIMALSALRMGSLADWVTLEKVLINRLGMSTDERELFTDRSARFNNYLQQWEADREAQHQMGKIILAEKFAGRVLFDTNRVENTIHREAEPFRAVEKLDKLLEDVQPGTSENIVYRRGHFTVNRDDERNDLNENIPRITLVAKRDLEPGALIFAETPSFRAYIENPVGVPEQAVLRSGITTARLKTIIPSILPRCKHCRRKRTTEQVVDARERWAQDIPDGPGECACLYSNVPSIFCTPGTWSKLPKDIMGKAFPTILKHVDPSDLNCSPADFRTVATGPLRGPAVLTHETVLSGLRGGEGSPPAKRRKLSLGEPEWVGGEEKRRMMNAVRTRRTRVPNALRLSPPLDSVGSIPHMNQKTKRTPPIGGVGGITGVPVPAAGRSNAILTAGKGRGRGRPRGGRGKGKTRGGGGAAPAPLPVTRPPSPPPVFKKDNVTIKKWPAETTCLESAQEEGHDHSCSLDWAWLHKISSDVNPDIIPGLNRLKSEDWYYESHYTLLGLLFRDAVQKSLKRREQHPPTHGWGELPMHETDELIVLNGNPERKTVHLNERNKTPFRFSGNIQVPFHVLEILGINPFTQLDFDGWVIQSVLWKLAKHMIPFSTLVKTKTGMGKPHERPSRTNKQFDYDATKLHEDEGIDVLPLQHVHTHFSSFRLVCRHEMNAVWTWDQESLGLDPDNPEAMGIHAFNSNKEPAEAKSYLQPNRIVVFAVKPIPQESEIRLWYKGLHSNNDEADMMFRQRRVWRCMTCDDEYKSRIDTKTERIKARYPNGRSGADL